MSAPERIWAKTHGAYKSYPSGREHVMGGWSDEDRFSSDTEYIRAYEVQRLIAEAVARERDRGINLLDRLQRLAIRAQTLADGDRNKAMFGELEMEIVQAAAAIRNRKETT